MEKKKINLKQIEVEIDYNGTKAITDVSEPLASAIFNNAENYDDFELGREIHKKGEVEIDEQQAQAIKKYIPLGFKIFVQPSIIQALDNLFNNNQN